MDIDSDDASYDVVECSDGKEATGSDKEIKGHLVDIYITFVYTARSAQREPPQTCA